MEDFFDNIVKHNCQKIFPPDCTEVFIVEKPRRGRNFARFSPLAFAAQNFRGRSSRSPLARPLRKKTQPLSDCVFFRVAGWASRRIGLRCACPIGFLRGKNPVRLSPFRATKNATLSDCVFFKVAGWTSGRIGLRYACPIGFLRGKNPVRLSPARSAKKRNPYRIAFFSSGGMGFGANWTALRLPYRVFARQKSRSPLTFPRHKKRNPFGLRFLQSGGMDETRTRDLLRDRQAF